MVKSLLLFLSAVILISFISKKDFAPVKVTTPPGTVQLKDSLYIDRIEVTNEMWRAFTEGWLLKKENDSATYAKMQPDSAVWYSLKFNSEHYVTYYFTSIGYGDYPVVGITYEQAVAYCEWRTERVNEYLERTKDAAFKSVVYRLPTEAEWELAAAGKLDPVKYPHGYERVKDGKKDDSSKVINCFYPDIDSVQNTLQNLIMPSLSGKPNQYGIYNIMGNAGEMVSEKGLSKGGFYDAPLQFCTVKEKFSYKEPNRYLGFRCVCLVDNAFSFKKQKEAFKQQLKQNKKPTNKKDNKGFDQ